MDKEKEAGKKLWSKPELTVLVRNKPEETVLAACKKSSGFSGSNDAFDGCWQDSPGCNTACFSHDGS
jgi:hypothetical protein